MFDFLLASLIGALLIVIVMILRKVTREKYRSSMIMFLWGVVLLRLLIPFNLVGSNALVTLRVPERIVLEAPVERPKPTIIPAGQINKPTVQTETKKPAVDQTNAETQGAMVGSESAATSTDLFGKFVSFLKQHTWEQWLFAVWLAGTLASSLYLVITRIRFMKKIKEDIVRLEDDEILRLVPPQMPVFITKKHISPLVVGLWRPFLIVPQSLIAQKGAGENKEESQKLHFALRHEVMHIKRKDLWWKSLYLVARSIHWFNPLVWCMGDLLNQDIEYACDEALISKSNEQEKVAYCQAILDIAQLDSARPDNFTSRFSGGAKMLKTRIHKIICSPLHKRGRTIAIGLALIMSMSLIAVSCISQTPESTKTDPDASTTLSGNNSTKPNASSSEPKSTEPSEKGTDPSHMQTEPNQPSGFRPGYWYGENAFTSGDKIEFFFTDDGEYMIDRQISSCLSYMLYGTYKREGDNIIMTSNGDDGSLTFKIDGDRLVLMEQDLISTLFPNNYTLERDNSLSQTKFSPEQKKEASVQVYFRNVNALQIKPDLIAIPNHFSFAAPERKIGSTLYFADYKGFFGFDLEKKTMVHAIQITDPNFPTGTQGDCIRRINITKDGKKLLFISWFNAYSDQSFPGFTTLGFVRSYWYEYDLQTKMLERKFGHYDELKANIKEPGKDELNTLSQYKWVEGLPANSYREAVLMGPDGENYKPFEQLLP